MKNKRILIILFVLALIVLGRYGYNNWGWFGGKKSLATILQESGTSVPSTTKK